MDRPLVFSVAPRLRATLAAGGVAVFWLAAALLVWGATRGPAIATPHHAPLLQIERDGVRFVFHAPTGASALYDVKADSYCRQNLIARRPGEALALRRTLERELGVLDLSQISDEFLDVRTELRRLGYL